MTQSHRSHLHRQQPPDAPPLCWSMMSPMYHLWCEVSVPASLLRCIRTIRLVGVEKQCPSCLIGMVQISIWSFRTTLSSGMISMKEQVRLRGFLLTDISRETWDTGVSNPVHFNWKTNALANKLLSCPYYFNISVLYCSNKTSLSCTMTIKIILFYSK